MELPPSLAHLLIPTVEPRRWYLRCVRVCVDQGGGQPSQISGHQRGRSRSPSRGRVSFLPGCPKVALTCSFHFGGLSLHCWPSTGATPSCCLLFHPPYVPSILLLSFPFPLPREDTRFRGHRNRLQLGCSCRPFAAVATFKRDFDLDLKTRPTSR